MKIKKREPSKIIANKNIASKTLFCAPNPKDLRVFVACKIYDFAVQGTKHAELCSAASKIEDFRKFPSTSKFYEF
jgi:hypothetical protein